MSTEELHKPEIQKIFELYAGKFWDNQDINMIVSGCYYARIYKNNNTTLTIDYNSNNISIQCYKGGFGHEIASVNLNDPDGPSKTEEKLRNWISATL